MPLRTSSPIVDAFPRVSFNVFAIDHSIARCQEWRPSRVWSVRREAGASPLSSFVEHVTVVQEKWGNWTRGVSLFSNHRLAVSFIQHRALANSDSASELITRYVVLSTALTGSREPKEDCHGGLRSVD